MTKEKIKLLEINFLDGDKIDDCGDCQFSVKGVMDVIDFFEKHNESKISKLLEDIVGKKLYILYITDVEEMETVEYEDIINEGKNYRRQEIIDLINKSEFKELINK